MTKTKTRIAAVIAVLVSALSGASRSASAQYFGDMGGSGASGGNIEGFAVNGKGFVTAKPNRLEIDLEVSASSELTADAIVKYRDAKRRLEDAFAALKLGNVTVEERGLLVDQKGAEMNPYFFDYTPSRKAKVEVQLTRKLVVKCADIRKLDEETLLQLVGKLLDVAQDAGGRVGSQNNMNNYYFYRYNDYSSQSGLVRFILDDYEKLEEDAYEKAVADATARAKRLAKLSQVKLGPVTAIREISSPGLRSNSNNDDETAKKSIEASKFQAIPVRVELMVRFNTSPLLDNNPKGGDQ